MPILTVHSKKWKKKCGNIGKIFAYSKSEEESVATLYIACLHKEKPTCEVMSALLDI